MDFGMPSLLELRTPEANAALCAELALDFVELNMDMPENQIDRLDTAPLAELAEQYGIYFTLHLEDTDYPWNFNHRLAMAYTETLLQVIKLAKRVPIPILTMHFHQGEYFTLPDRKAYLFAEYPEDYRRRLRAFRAVCTEAVGDAAIKICIENTRAFELDFVSEGIELLLESPVFALTLDTGHNAKSHFRQERLINRHQERLCHMHLHDYSTDSGDHLPLGAGELDCMAYLDLAKHHGGRAVLEAKTVDAVQRSVRWLREHGEFKR